LQWAEIKNKKIAVLYSGGLDSRLALRILQSQGSRVVAVFFKLPFLSDSSIKDNFLDRYHIPLKIFDCTKGSLLTEYLDILRNPHFGRGAGYNPCIDCKLFMFRQVHKYVIQNDLDGIATGAVPGQRPMSQTKQAQRIIDNQLSFRVIRPLQEIGLRGRGRRKQFQLAKKYHIDEYPTPAGGCRLCQKELAPRYATLLEHDLINEHTLPLIHIGRHYYFSKKGFWIVVGRNEQENKIIEQYEHNITSSKGTPAVYYHSLNNSENQIIAVAQALQTAYQQKDRAKIDRFRKYKL